MFKNERLTKAVLAKIDSAERMTLLAMNDQRVEHEPSITDRFLAYIEAKLDGEDIAGVHWQAKTPTSIGMNSQEFRHGADFFGGNLTGRCSADNAIAEFGYERFRRRASLM
jgi:hypothetical protein